MPPWKSRKIDPARGEPQSDFGVPAKRLNSRIHYGTAARMRIWSASEALEQQKPLGNRSENATFECQNAEFTIESQRKCNF